MRGRAGLSSGAGVEPNAVSPPSGPRTGFLRIAVVGPTHSKAGRLGRYTVALAAALHRAGHDATLVSWSAEDDSGPGPDPVDPLPPRVHSLSLNRPGTWLRTGRRLQAYDAVLLVPTGAAMVPVLLALLRMAAMGRGRPRTLLIGDALLPTSAGLPFARLVSSVLSRVDGALVHDREMAMVARRLGASRVSSVEEPPLDRRGDDGGPGTGTAATELSTSWASYVGAIEAMAAGDIDTHPEVEDAERRHTDGAVAPHGPRVINGLSGPARRAANLAVAPFAKHAQLGLTRASLPEWVVGSDVLDDGWQAEEAREEARRLALPRTRNPVAAWAALGALAAVIRVADDGHGRALIADESGPGSPLTRWLTACGFAPVDLGLTFEGSSGYGAPDLEPGCLDVVARLHPGGCDASDVDEAVAAAAWALRPGGLLVLTVPLGRGDADPAMGPADVRALVARAHEHGFVLVGDLDGRLGHRMRAAAVAAGQDATCAEGAAYGLVRLTLRRR